MKQFDRAEVVVSQISRKILIAEDEEAHLFLTQEALKINELPHKLYAVTNGEELMDYLYHRANYSNREIYPDPDLILLDINMPGKNGFEALAEIKADPNLASIPVVILSTSKRQEDRIKAEALKADLFIVKPLSFDVWVDAIKAVSIYWQE